MNKTVCIRHGYIHFPIGRDAERYYVRFSCGSHQIHELYIGLSDKPDFWCQMDLREYIGKEILIETDDGVPALDLLIEGGDMSELQDLYPDLYHETFRPQYHFSPRRGWMNDPNGLFWKDGKYHLYFQHNPYGILHGGVNIHWGHATSMDAVHWHEDTDALSPWNCERHIASGSCIVDSGNTSGYGVGTVIAAFTSLGSRNFKKSVKSNGRHAVFASDGQYLAYSRDDGAHFSLFPENPVIASLHGADWRKVRMASRSM